MEDIPRFCPEILFLQLCNEALCTSGTCWHRIAPTHDLYVSFLPQISNVMLLEHLIIWSQGLEKVQLSGLARSFNIGQYRLRLELPFSRIGLPVHHSQFHDNSLSEPKDSSSAGMIVFSCSLNHSCCCAMDFHLSSTLRRKSFSIRR